MNLVDQNPGRGSGVSRHDQKTSVTVTRAAPNQTNTPAASSHGVEPGDITMMPTRPRANPT
jgi:hypothetical protein